MKLSGMIYFVIHVEGFSGKFKLECVQNQNHYLEQGYLSTFFDKTNTKFKKGKFITDKN